MSCNCILFLDANVETAMVKDVEEDTHLYSNCTFKSFLYRKAGFYLKFLNLKLYGR